MNGNAAEQLQNGGQVIEMPQSEKREVMTLVDSAKALVIRSDDDYAKGGSFIKGLKAGKKKITDFFKPMKDKAKAAHQEICDREKEATGPIDEAERIVRRNMEVFATEQERKRREEQAILDAQARDRLAKEQEKLLNRAATAEEKGQHEKAEALIDQAEDSYATPAVAQSGVAQTVRTSDTTVSKNMDYEIEVVDLKAFITALVEQNSNAFDALFKVGVAPLKAWRKSNGIKNFPGLRITEKVGVSIR